MTNRRSFLSGLAAIAACATLDQERMLWKPGKLISIPRPKSQRFYLMRTFFLEDEFVNDAIKDLAAEVRSQFNVYEFHGLPLPTVGIARSATVINGIPVRTVAAYVAGHDRYLGHVDCMFDGYSK